MTRVEIVAGMYGLSVAEVARWPRPVVVRFYHAGLNRGWLVPTCEESNAG